MRICEVPFTHEEYYNQWHDNNGEVFCGGGFDNLLRQFKIPSNVKNVIISLHNQKSPDRKPVRIVKNTYEYYHQSEYPVVSIRFRNNGLSHQEYYDNEKVGKKLTPYIGKTVYLQIEYDE